MTDGPDDLDLVRALRERLESVAEDVREAVEKLSESAQFEFDKQFGKAVAQHPELYAELRRTYRQVRRGLDKLGKDLGWK